MTELERVAVAIELVAQRLGDPDQALVDRIATLEDALKEFVSVMQDPASTDQMWLDLLVDAKTLLGLETEGETS
jgi:hypothetical protein